MKLSDLRNRCKIKIPNLKATGIDDPSLDAIINEGVREVNLLAKVYRGYTDFNIVAGQGSQTSPYLLSTIANTFQQIVTAGLWIKSSASAEFTRIIPKTEEWFNKRMANWRSGSNATIAQYYYISGNNLVIYPQMSANVSLGGRLHHLILPATMADGDKYPFSGSAVEITALRPMDNAIVEYVRWQLAPSLDKETGEDRSYPMFINMVKLARSQCRAIPDAINYYDTAISIST